MEKPKFIVLKIIIDFCVHAIKQIRVFKQCLAADLCKRAFAKPASKLKTTTIEKIIKNSPEYQMRDSLKFYFLTIAKKLKSFIS